MVRHVHPNRNHERTMKVYALRDALRRRLAALADRMTITVSGADASTSLYVFHPMGVIRVITPDEQAELDRRAA